MPPPCADAKRRVLICGRSLATRVATSVRRMRNYWIAFCYFNEVQKTERTGNVWGKGGRERGNPWIWDIFFLSFVLFLRTFKYKCRTYLYVNSLINALPNQNWIVIDKIMINRSEEVKFIELSPVYAQMLHKNLYTMYDFCLRSSWLHIFFIRFSSCGCYKSNISIINLNSGQLVD